MTTDSHIDSPQNPLFTAGTFLGMAVGVMFMLYSVYAPIFSLSSTLMASDPAIQQEAMYEVVTPEATYHHAHIITTSIPPTYTKHGYYPGDSNFVIKTEDNKVVHLSGSASTQLESDQTPRYYALVKKQDNATKEGVGSIGHLQVQLKWCLLLIVVCALVGFVFDLQYLRWAQNSQVSTNRSFTDLIKKS